MARGYIDGGDDDDDDDDDGNHDDDGNCGCYLIID